MRSDVVKKGVPAAPNRSLLYALGYTKEELERPLIGVVCSYNEIVPGHMNLDKIAEAVKAGIRAAGGTPVEFPAIAVCDGIAMGHVGMKYSLVTRDLIADSTEAMALAHQFDGLVMIPNCDKNVPGLLMAAARVNVPTIFVSGGPMLAGTLNDGRRTCLSHMFEAVGAHYAGKLDDAGLEEYEENACPTCGSCSGMYTANSMNCLTEAIGMALAGNGTIIYGSYLSDKEDTVSSAVTVAVFDTCAAMLAALVIIPAMATTGAILSESGPGLMFISLPYLFKSMPGGQIVMIVFFVAVLFAGLTSLVNLFEAPIAALQDHMHLSRLKSVAIVGLIGVVVSVCIQGIVSPWMDFVSIYVCPLGAALAGIMFAWVWGRQAVEDAVSVGRKHRIGKWYYPLYKYLFCVLTAAVFILGAVNGGIG